MTVTHRIEINPKIMMGKPVIRGTRITVELLLRKLAEGATEKDLLDAYYTATFTPRFVEQWTVAGTPRQCVADLQAYFDAGVGHMALRLASWDQPGQLKRFLGEVAPAFGGR